MTNATVIESVKDAIAIGSNIVDSAEKDVAWVVPCSVLALTARYNLNKNAEALIKRGGQVRGITQISSSNVELVNDFIRIGEDVRHVTRCGRLSYARRDNGQSISSEQISIEDLSCDDRIVAFWSQDPDYAALLLKNFESAWTQGVDAQEYISCTIEGR